VWFAVTKDALRKALVKGRDLDLELGVVRADESSDLENELDIHLRGVRELQD
jgi:hypothetical protein